MTRASSLPLTLTLGALTFTACGENSAPTQPETAGPPTSAVPSFAVASNTWIPKAAYPVQDMHEFSVGVVPNSAGQPILYALGGTDDQGGSCFQTQAYNAATNTWTARTSRICERNTNGVGRIKGKLYVSGGYLRDRDDGFSRNTYAYDPSTDKLTLKADMPKFAGEGVSGMIDDKVYVLPGYCSDSRWPLAGYCDHTEFRRLWRYNPATNLWATKRSAPHYHRLAAGGVINGKFYVAGGYNGFVAEAALDVYDPATDTWKTLAPLPTAGRAEGAVLLGKLFVVAWGESQTERHLYVYNPANNTWATKAPPSKLGPVARVDLGGLPYLLLVSAQGSELYKP